MRQLDRKARIAVGAILLGVALPAVATAASAGSWSGYQSCPISTVVKATGHKGNSGTIKVVAGGNSYTDTTPGSGYNVTVPSASSSANWSVTGAGATSGYGYCGT